MVQGLVSQYQQLKLQAVLHGQPMQSAKNGRDMIPPGGYVTRCYGPAGGYVTRCYGPAGGYVRRCYGPARWIRDTMLWSRRGIRETMLRCRWWIRETMLRSRWWIRETMLRSRRGIRDAMRAAVFCTRCNLASWHARRPYWVVLTSRYVLIFHTL